MSSPHWRVELWDDLQAAGGVRKAVVPVLQGTIKRDIDNQDRLNIEAWLDTEWLQHAALRGVLRTEGPSTAPTEAYEWRINEIRRGRGQGEDKTVSLKAVSPVNDLRFVGLIQEQSTAGQIWFNMGGVGLTPTQYMETFIPPTLALYGSTYVAIGTVDDTAPLDMAWDRWTPRQLLDELVSRTETELEYVAAGTSGYTLNMWTERGSTAPQRHLTVGRNVRVMRWRQQLEQLQSVVTPSGQTVLGAIEASGIQNAAWAVDAITFSGAAGTSGGVFTLIDVSSGDGPIAFNDQLSTHWALLPDASLAKISSASTANVLRTTDDISSLSTGQRVEFRASSGGMHMTELVNPAVAATSASGRIAFSYEDPDFRGEHNLVRSGLWGEWTGETLGYGGLASSSGSTGTTIQIRNLPTSGFTINEGDVVRQFVVSGVFREFRVTANATADGSGNTQVTLGQTLTPNSSTRVWLYLQSSSRGPTPWVRGSSNYPVYYQRRDSSLTGTLTGLVADTTGSLLHSWQMVSGFSTADVIMAGDILVSSSLGNRRILGNSLPSSSGVARITIGNNGLALTSGSTLSITRPTGLSADAGQYFASFTVQDGNTAAVGSRAFLESAPWTVRYDPTLPLIQVSVGLSYHALAKSTGLAAASAVYTPLEIVLWDKASSASLMTIQDADLDLAAGAVENRTITGTTTLSSDTQVTLRVYPPRVDSLTQAFEPDPWVYVRYAMLTIGSDPTVPPKEGSYGSALWQRANRKLAEFSGEPDVYEVDIDDISTLPGYVSTDESLTLGGTIRLKDASLGVDSQLRIVSIENDLTDSRRAKIQLARRPLLLTERVADVSEQTKISLLFNISGTTSTSAGAGGYGGEQTGEPVAEDVEFHQVVVPYIPGKSNSATPGLPGAIRAVPGASGTVTKKVYPKYS